MPAVQQQPTAEQHAAAWAAYHAAQAAVAAGGAVAGGAQLGQQTMPAVAASQAGCVPPSARFDASRMPAAVRASRAAVRRVCALQRVAPGAGA